MLSTHAAQLKASSQGVTMTRPPTPILHTLDTGGSGTGFHYYASYGAGCPRAAVLNEKAKANGENGLLSNNGLTVGTLGHALMALHFGRALSAKQDPTIIRFSDVVDEEARYEAERCFRAFREQYPNPECYGKVIAIEKQIDSCSAVTEAVGVEPYTLRPDLVTKMTKKDVTWVLKNCEVENGQYLKPGYWMLDHKFDGRKNQAFLDRAMESKQFHSYFLGWNAAMPRMPLQGVMRHTIFKYKEPRVLLTVVPPPSERQIKSLHAFYEWCCFVIENRPTQAIAHENNCFPMWGVCRWWKENLCQGF
jgi:hypothetical protein